MNLLNINNIKDYPVICCLGKRRSGKTFLIRDLIYNHFVKIKKYKNIILISPTAHIDQSNSYSFIDDKYKFEEFSESLLLNLMKRQAELIKRDRKGSYNTLLILDDVINMSDKRESKLLASLLVKSRHYRISIILSLQYMKSQEFTPASRDNIDYLFVFPQTSTENIKNISSQWFGGSKEKEMKGRQLIESVPDIEDHNILVIDNTEINLDINKMIYEYIAHPIPDKFRLKN